MIEGCDRLIIVLGMAHSGTTILTHILRQHRDVLLAVDGSEAWIHENTWLPLEQAQPIQELLKANPNKKILLKRPWNTLHHGDWMVQEMPVAKFIYCYRDFEAIAQSWSKQTSLVDDKLRSGGLEYQRAYYDVCWEKAEAFSRRVPNFFKVYHPGFVEHPKWMMTQIATWIGLALFRFNVSEVSTTKNIKDVLCRA